MLLWAPFGCHPKDWAPIFKLNTAAVKISNYENDADLFLRSDICTGCAWRKECGMSGDGTTLLVSITHAMHVKVANGVKTLCEKTLELGNQGTYALDVGKCQFSEVIAAENPIYSWVIILIGLAVMLFGHDLYLLVKNGFSPKQTDANEFNFGNIPTKPPAKRLLSVSVMRGFAIFLMAFMNAFGGGKIIFMHSEWDGITLSDFFYPVFLFCAGMSSQVAMTYRTAFDFKGFLIRSFKNVLIGLFIVNGGLDWRTLRFMGILQRLVICQLVLVPLQVWQNVKQEDLVTLRAKKLGLPVEESDDKAEAKETEKEKENGTVRRRKEENGGVKKEETKENKASGSLLWSLFGEWATISAVAVATIALNIVYLYMRYIPVEGCPIGYGGPGGLDAGGKYPHCTGGFFGAFDRAVFGKHVYDGALCKHVWQCIDIDPEGMLTSIGSMINIAVGIHAAQILRWYPTRAEQNTRFIAYGIATTLIGLLFNEIAPPNKQMWTHSFAFITAGGSYFLYLIFRTLVDQEETYVKLRSMAYLGDNSMLIYVLQEAWKFRLPYHFYVGYTSVGWSLLGLWTAFVTLAVSFYTRAKGITLRL